MCGSKTVTGGALVLNCCGGVNKVDGCTVGGDSKVGKPPATLLLMLGELTQPVVIVVNGKVVVQLWTNPGTRPAAAVTWNDEIVSKAMPYPSRMTLLLLPPKSLCSTPDLKSGL